MATSSSQPGGIDFCTLGMYIIDEIHPPPTSPHPPSLNIPGGAGLYSALGARLLSPAPHLSSTIGWIVDAGTDFPPSHFHLITSWSTSAVIRSRGEGIPTTRGWNGYSGNQVRAFKYLTAKKRITAEDLSSSSSSGGPFLLGARSFHLICSPGRCEELVEGIQSRRKDAGLMADDDDDDDHLSPLMIWEPVPDLCTAEELGRTMETNRKVDVMSPNHDELAAMFGTAHGGGGVVEGVDWGMVEEQAGRMVEAGIGRDGRGVIVVRCGAVGCFVLSREVRRWLPAYHSDARKVVDPTGGGNGFLGGLAVGLVRTGGDVVEAARWGSVAASFCIEQVGVPRLEASSSSSTTNGDGGERWNGANVLDRLAEFRQRTT